MAPRFLGKHGNPSLYLVVTMISQLFTPTYPVCKWMRERHTQNKYLLKWGPLQWIVIDHARADDTKLGALHHWTHFIWLGGGQIWRSGDLLWLCKVMNVISLTVALCLSRLINLSAGLHYTDASASNCLWRLQTDERSIIRLGVKKGQYFNHKLHSSLEIKGE